MQTKNTYFTLRETNDFRIDNKNYQLSDDQTKFVEAIFERKNRGESYSDMSARYKLAPNLDGLRRKWTALSVASASLMAIGIVAMAAIAVAVLAFAAPVSLPLAIAFGVAAGATAAGLLAGGASLYKRSHPSL